MDFSMISNKIAKKMKNNPCGIVIFLAEEKGGFASIRGNTVLPKIEILWTGEDDFFKVAILYPNFITVS